MIITAIEKQKKNPERYSIFIDGEFAFGLDGDDLLRYRLVKGTELSPREKEDILEECVYKKAMNKAVRLLAVRARSCREIRDRLSEDDYAEEIAERVINALLGCGYLNDESFAAELIESLLSRGYGERAIIFKLAEKGLTRESISLISGFEEKELEAASAAIRKKFRTGEQSLDRDAMHKALAYLAGRGFSFETAKTALDELIKTGGAQYEENNDYI